MRILFVILAVTVGLLTVSSSVSEAESLRSGAGVWSAAQGLIVNGWEWPVYLSENGLSLIKSHEGLRLDAYKDSANVWTVGFGHTLGVQEGLTVTLEQAEHFLRTDTAHAVQAVNGLVKVPLSQNQFDALVSLVFNIGPRAFENSTVLNRLNAGDYKAAADAMLMWNKISVGGEKKALAGLTRRRRLERQLFLRAM